MSRIVVLLALALASCGTQDQDPIVIDTGASADSAGEDLGAYVDAGSSATDLGTPDLGVDLGAPDEGSATADMWDAFAQTWFSDFCVRCHASGSSRDYTTPDHVERDQERIRCGVAPTLPAGCSPASFPVNAPYPDDAERARLVAWIDAGLP